MRHLRRSSRMNDKVGTGKRVLDHASVPVTGEEALVQAPRPYSPRPLCPPLARLETCRRCRAEAVLRQVGNGIFKLCEKCCREMGH